MNLLHLIPFKAKVVIPEGAIKHGSGPAGEPPFRWLISDAGGRIYIKPCLSEEDFDLIDKEVIVVGALTEDTYICGYQGRQTAEIGKAFLEFVEPWQGK